MDVLNRNTFIEILEEIRNTEKLSVDQYIEKRLIPFQSEHPQFIKTLYKDICYILEGLDHEGDNDLEVMNGDFKIEDGDIKLTGYQTRLHDISIWLHMAVVNEMIEESGNPATLASRIEEFENNFLRKMNYTPEYRAKLDTLKASLKVERRYNYDGKRKSSIYKLFDFDH